MPRALNLVSDSVLHLAPNGVSTEGLPRGGGYRLSFRNCAPKPIVCVAKKRNRNEVGRSAKLIIGSACIIASKLRLFPEPVELILREFGGGNGGRNGIWNRFGGGGYGSNGGNSRRMKFKILGILVISVVAVGFWSVIGKELGFDADAFLGGLGLFLLGLSVGVWKSGARDWILGFCCCAVVMLASKRDKFRKLFGSFVRVKKNSRRKIRVL
ncbi:uncharacterized protein LOC127260451 [Andrographis paniculata]|uniref:uncharacterized protein LOC127260451 n=1 Tax=Andrographis paniculata TaxID=175694 RepID=UPI0021E9A990|nr:uncharacterized protein LOC127260451 [Andrographis paniculata]